MLAPDYRGHPACQRSRWQAATAASGMAVISRARPFAPDANEPSCSTSASDDATTSTVCSQRAELLPECPECPGSPDVKRSAASGCEDMQDVEKTEKAGIDGLPIDELLGPTPSISDGDVRLNGSNTGGPSPCVAAKCLCPVGDSWAAEDTWESDTTP